MYPLWAKEIRKVHLFFYSLFCGSYFLLDLFLCISFSHSEPNIATAAWRRSRRKVITEQRTASSRFTFLWPWLLFQLISPYICNEALYQFSNWGWDHTNKNTLWIKSVFWSLPLTYWKIKSFEVLWLQFSPAHLSHYVSSVTVRDVYIIDMQIGVPFRAGDVIF